MGLTLLAHGAFEFRVFHALAQHLKQINTLIPDAPGRTHAVIAELGKFVRCVPTLDYLLETLREVTRAVRLEPSSLNQTAF